MRNEALFVDKRGITLASKIDLEIEKLEKLNQLEIERNSTTNKAELETSTFQKFKNTETTIQNKSLLFDGKPLNLLERFKIADKVLGIDQKIRTLNIGDLQKYQLLAYILGCDKDNARNLMNGCYKSKPRDLSTYFNDLDLNK